MAVNHIEGALASVPVPDKPKSRFYIADAERFEELGDMLKEAEQLYNGLSGMVARGEISGLQCKVYAAQLPAMIKRLRAERGKLLRRRGGQQPSVMGKVFCFDTITRTANAVAMNRRLA